MIKGNKKTQRNIRRLLGPSLLVLVIGGLCLAALVAYQLPPVHDRLAWRVESLQSRMQRALNPPEELVFVPQGADATQPTPPVDVAAAVEATMNALTGATPSPTQHSQTGVITPIAGSSPVVTATSQPSVTPTILPPPPMALLSGVRHEYQQFNNCGPANLAMLLSYWGWQGDQRDTRAYLRPNLDVDDKNVMPEEMVAYVEQFTEMKALARVGGNVDLLRRLIAANFPVMIEAGHHPPKDWWMGHYLVVTGYDDATQTFTVQDSLLNPDQPMTFTELGSGWWRDFNYVFVLAFPEDRQAELMSLLGEHADPAAAYRLAEGRALEEVQQLSGRDRFFAWFNLGSSRVGLKDYAAAAEAYDQAFAEYGRLSEDMRPYRLMWYQVGPYEAYYHTGRYEDVITLANTTFSWVGQPVLEESYFWRGLAYVQTGQVSLARADFEKAAELNPNYAPPREELAKLGAGAP